MTSSGYFASYLPTWCVITAPYTYFNEAIHQRKVLDDNYNITGSYHPVRKISKKVAPVCSSTKTCVCKLLQQRIGIEASYITVHSYDILVIITLILSSASIRVITKISYSYCDITITKTADKG